MFKAVVKWRNGSGGVFSDVYSENLSNKKFTEWGAQAVADKLFPTWRRNNPEEDGWRVVAWASTEEV